MPNFNLDNYVPVNQRLEQFYKDFPQGRVTTELVEHDRETGFVMFKSLIYRNLEDAEPSATGHAFENRGEGYVNKTSYIENCETSAVGRALALLGYEITKGIASREEMAKVERMTPPEQPKAQAAHAGSFNIPIPKIEGEQNPGIARSLADTVTAKQLGMITAICRGMKVNADEHCASVIGCRTDELSKSGASEFIKHLQAESAKLPA